MGNLVHDYMTQIIHFVLYCIHKNTLCTYFNILWTYMLIGLCFWWTMPWLLFCAFLTKFISYSSTGDILFAVKKGLQCCWPLRIMLWTSSCWCMIAPLLYLHNGSVYPFLHLAEGDLEDGLEVWRKNRRWTAIRGHVCYSLCNFTSLPQLVLFTVHFKETSSRIERLASPISCSSIWRTQGTLFVLSERGGETA